MTNNCPICFSSMVTDRDYQEGTLLEEYGKCEDEYHYYAYQYAYGNTSETIGVVTIVGHHGDTKELRSLRTQQFNAVVKLERDSYLEKISEYEPNPDIESIFTIQGDIIKHNTITEFNIYPPTQDVSFTIPRATFTLAQWTKIRDGIGISMSLTILKKGDNTTTIGFHGGATGYDTPDISVDGRITVERVVIQGHLSRGYANN